MNWFVHFSEHALQELALGFMALVYITRVVWFLRFKAGTERQGQTGPVGTTPTKGILYSWANIAMPWAMESTRTKCFLYLQFVVFHLGVTAGILLSFVILRWTSALQDYASGMDPDQLREKQGLSKVSWYETRAKLDALLRGQGTLVD